MKTILFVDDHLVLANLSCEILEMEGYRAVSAGSGTEALKKFQEDTFDLLVTDFRMAGMNGLELARRIHEIDPEFPVILVTGYGAVDIGQEALACLQKDELFPALLEQIRMFIGDAEEPQAMTA